MAPPSLSNSTDGMQRDWLPNLASVLARGQHFMCRQHTSLKDAGKGLGQTQHSLLTPLRYSSALLIYAT